MIEGIKCIRCGISKVETTLRDHEVFLIKLSKEISFALGKSEYQDFIPTSTYGLTSNIPFIELKVNAHSGVLTTPHNDNVLGSGKVFCVEIVMDYDKKLVYRLDGKIIDDSVFGKICIITSKSFYELPDNSNFHSVNYKRLITNHFEPRIFHELSNSLGMPVLHSLLTDFLDSTSELRYMESGYSSFKTGKRNSRLFRKYTSSS